MKVKEDVVRALADTVSTLRRDDPRPIPTGALAALAPLAQPGMKLGINVAASAEVGAPVITVLSQPDERDALFALTPRQRQVARLVARGRSNREIAEELGITVATVKDHVHAILDRLGLPSRAAVSAAMHGSRED